MVGRPPDLGIGGNDGGCGVLRQLWQLAWRETAAAVWTDGRRSRPRSEVHYHQRLRPASRGAAVRSYLDAGAYRVVGRPGIPLPSGFPLSRE